MSMEVLALVIGRALPGTVGAVADVGGAGWTGAAGVGGGGVAAGVAGRCVAGGEMRAAA